MKPITLYSQRFIQWIHHLKSRFFLLLVWSAAFFGVIFMAQADIYKWQDDTGVVYYSNHPPADLSRIIEIIPSENAASDSADGPGNEPKVYYFSSPNGQPSESFTVPPEVLQELFDEQPQAVATNAPPSNGPDLSALTMQLAHIERTLQQEVEARVQWQQQYAQAQSVIKTLEQQNQALNTALATMEDDIDFLRGTVVASDMEVTALKQGMQPGQYAMLENSVTGIREQVQTMSLDLETLDAQGLSQKLAMLTADMRSVKTQQDYDYALHLRLESLERDVRQLAETPPAQNQSAEVVTPVADSGQTFENMNAHHDRRLEAQQAQIAALEAELELLKASRVPSDNPAATLDDTSQALVAQLVENNQFMKAMLKHQAQTLQAQNEQIKAIQAQLPVAQTLESTYMPISGIRIIPHLERRRTASLAGRIVTWLATPSE